MNALMFAEVLRFRDLRPINTDTNLFTYHLKILVKQRMVEKTEGGYKLGIEGLAYVDRVSTEKKAVRTQPKIITMLVVQNSDGDILMQKRTKQPYINEWTLPYGKIHIDDPSTISAAKRECLEKLGLTDQEVQHAGDCYIRVHSDGGLLSTTLTHVFRVFQDDIKETENLQWTRPHKIDAYRLAPAVSEVMTRTFFNDPFFFEEFDVWRN